MLLYNEICMQYFIELNRCNYNYYILSYIKVRIIWKKTKQHNTKHIFTASKTVSRVYSLY